MKHCTTRRKNTSPGRPSPLASLRQPRYLDARGVHRPAQGLRVCAAACTLAGVGGDIRIPRGPLPTLPGETNGTCRCRGDLIRRHVFVCCMHASRKHGISRVWRRLLDKRVWPPRLEAFATHIPTGSPRRPFVILVPGCSSLPPTPAGFPRV